MNAAEIVDRGVFGLRTCGRHRILKLGDGRLPISLTERNQSNRGGHQIGEIALQEGGQRDCGWNALPLSRERRPPVLN